MVILEKPYISDHLLHYLEENWIPVLNNEFAMSLTGYRLNLINSIQAVELIHKGDPVYSASENGLDWVLNYAGNHKTADTIRLMKDKARFRQLISDLYPDFYFKECSYSELVSIEPSALTYPIVLKPSSGFFSLGVHSVFNAEEFSLAVNEVKKEQEGWSRSFPDSVVGSSRFLLEQYITGTEYAVDAYYDDEGAPVVLNIFTHRFTSPEDVSDRVYYTSKSIIQSLKPRFEQFLSQINVKLDARNFPVHAEIRVDQEQGTMLPIEFNPLRFAGLCCTDIAYYAYGINTVDYYLNHKVPDFTSILTDYDDTLYSLIVLDKSDPSISNDQFDYDRLTDSFDRVLALRRADTEALNIYGFLFTATKEDHTGELDHILSSDLTEYLYN